MRDMSVFGRCLGAAGVQGFFGEGYWFHNIPLRKPDFTDMTFVSKTATLHPRQGNVKTGWKEKFFPSWAKMKVFSGHTLNAMGLPNPGIKALLETGKWQERKEPFFISIMAVENTLPKRLDELRWITDIIAESVALRGFAAKTVGIQLNRSCPNTGHNINVGEIVEESEKGLEILSPFGWSLVEKFAIDTAPINAIKELQYNPYCDGICVSNTVKYGYRGLGQKIWGKQFSPLTHLGGGGISGPILLPLVCDYITQLRDAGFKKNINGCGGIFCADDVNKYRNAGADSVCVGTVAAHHPGQVGRIIRRANSLAWRKS